MLRWQMGCRLIFSLELTRFLIKSSFSRSWRLSPQPGDFTFTIKMKGGCELDRLNRSGKDEIL